MPSVDKFQIALIQDAVRMSIVKEIIYAMVEYVPAQVCITKIKIILYQAQFNTSYIQATLIKK